MADLADCCEIGCGILECCCEVQKAAQSSNKHKNYENINGEDLAAAKRRGICVLAVVCSIFLVFFSLLFAWSFFEYTYT